MVAHVLDNCRISAQQNVDQVSSVHGRLLLAGEFDVTILGFLQILCEFSEEKP